MELEQLARFLNATLFVPPGVEMDPKRSLSDISPLDAAKEDHLSFVLHHKFIPAALESPAYAFITGGELPNLKKVQLIHPEPRLAMARAGNYFYQQTTAFFGQSPLAFVAETACVASSASVFPFAYIDEGAVIGENCCIYPHVYVGRGCTIGERSVLYPGCIIMDGTTVGKQVVIHGGAVIGADGFGFLPDKDGTILKIPQKGTVELEDLVEIGPLVTIDRATFNKTLIKRGTKLDSQVHVGHNVQIGENSMLCGQVGIAGSSKIGKNFIAAGQVGIASGVEIADNVTLGGKTGVTRSITAAGQYLGMPAVNTVSWHKQSIAVQKLPELVKKVAELEAQMARLQQQLDKPR
jgi:UDP-3-O-[3-hydroxymyristoyl] glucosamine N-acyltransferase